MKYYDKNGNLLEKGDRVLIKGEEEEVIYKDIDGTLYIDGNLVIYHYSNWRYKSSTDEDGNEVITMLDLSLIKED